MLYNLETQYKTNLTSSFLFSSQKKECVAEFLASFLSSSCNVETCNFKHCISVSGSCTPSPQNDYHHNVLPHHPSHCQQKIHTLWTLHHMAGQPFLMYYWFVSFDIHEGKTDSTALALRQRLAPGVGFT